MLALVTVMLAVSDGGTSEPLVERPGVAAQTGAHLAFAGGVLVSTLATVALVYAPGRVAYDVAGRPEPLVTTSAMAVAAGLKLLATWFLLPELYRLGGGHPDIEQTRETMWRWVRWPALGAALSITLLIVGSALEQNQWGRGQAVLIAGAAGLSLSLPLFDIFAIVGSGRGYRR
ncbi:MAG: hypothetical protein JNK82_32435 [Myxococcaceae bacterium]|nr:hypothetical protein [Myxococcaceae bacterium]